MIKEQKDMAELAEKFGPLLSEDSGDFRDFMQVAAVVELDKGQYVCHEGHACSHLALILDGTARVYKLGENGREITLYRVGPGESCILTASCILSSLPFPAFAVCESRVRAAVIPAAKVQQWLAHWPAWRDYVFGLVARRLTNVISVVEEVAFKRMDRRIADHLLASNKSILHTTHQEIASDLGTSREVVSRILKDLENMNLVEVHRGTVEILAPERLRNI